MYIFAYIFTVEDSHTHVHDNDVMTNEVIMPVQNVPNLITPKAHQIKLQPPMSTGTSNQLPVPVGINVVHHSENETGMLYISALSLNRQFSVDFNLNNL